MARTEIQSPVEWTRDVVGESWRSLRTVYYANTVAWRFLKSGALIFFGFFLWASSNVLLSYHPSWTFLHYPMAYGFVLIAYGPIHHAVVIPFSMRLKRRADDWSKYGRHLPNAGLALFLVVVLVLGTFPAGAMTFDFESSLEGAGADIDPDLSCVKATNDSATRVHCHLSKSGGISSVAVESGGEEVLVVEDPPFAFTFDAAKVAEVVGQKQFQVVLRDENGATIRRYTRTLSMIEEDTVDHRSAPSAAGSIGSYPRERR
jgi:uncharacterized membrane protein